MNRNISNLVLLTFFLSSLYPLFGQTSWDSFDTPGRVTYPFFNGTVFNQSFSNPSTTGNNTSAICAQYGRAAGAQFDVILVEPAGSLKVDNVSQYRLGTKQMSLKVYSPAIGKTIQITLEDKNVALPTNFPTGRHSEYTAVTTVANSWETLTFSLVNRPDVTVPDTTINRIVLLFDPNSFNSDTYLFDDIMGPELIDPCGLIATDTTIAEDYECQRNVSFDFANGTHLQNEANPLTTGINTSTTCGKFIKFLPPTNDGAFGGSLNHPFSSADLNTAHIELYSPSGASDFKMVFQDASGSDISDTLFVTSTTPGWQKFDMDLSGIPTTTSISKFVFLLNSPTATADSIYLDNFSFSFNNSVGINERSQENFVTLYPNPFNEQLEIKSRSLIKSVHLYSISGQLVYTANSVNTIKHILNLGELESGSYLISILEENGSRITRKVIKASN